MNSVDPTMGMAIIIVLIVYFFLRDFLIGRNIEKSALFTDYIDLLMPLILFLLAHTLMDSFNRILYNATLGTFFREVVVRLGNLAIILLFYFIQSSLYGISFLILLL